MRLRFDAKSQIKIAAAAEGQSSVRRISMVAYTGGSMQLDGWDHPMVIDLTDVRMDTQVIPVLYNHCREEDYVLGQTDSIKVQGVDVLAEGNLIAVSDRARRIVEMADAGYQWQTSVGGGATTREFYGEGQSVVVNGTQYDGPIYVGKGVVFEEISIVVLGADANTSALFATRANGMNFEQWLLSMGFEDASELSEVQLANLKNVYAQAYPEGETEEGEGEGEADPNAPAPAPAPVPAAAAAKAFERGLRISGAKEQRRQSAIRDLSSRYNVRRAAVDNREVDIVAHAIENNWTVERTELFMLKAARPTDSPIQGNGQVSQEAVLQCALFKAGRLKNVDEMFSPQVQEMAHKEFPRGLGLQEIVMIAAQANGYQGRFGRGGFKANARAILQHAFQAGFSTVSLPGIFSNTMNKFLLQGYDAVEQVWSLIAAKRNVSDFKTITSYRMTGSFQFEKVGPAGELKHATVGELSYTNRADSYGILHVITYQDLVNDDLGALTAVPQKIGRGAALKLNEVFWTAFMDNSSFFTTGNANYFEGAATNLQASSLATALQKFRDQKDADNKPLAVEPRVLLVPTALEVTALELMQSTNYNTGGAATDTKVPNKNIWAGRFTPAVSSYLSNTGITGNSTTAWYLLGDQNDVAVIEVCFLDGIETPLIESADADFNVLGIQARGTLHFGVAKQDYRGGVKSKGAA